MDKRELVKLASRGKIPCRKTSGGFVFRKSEVDHWVEQRMPELARHDLAKIEKGVSEHHGFDPHAMLICPLIPKGGIAVPLHARTRDAVLREMVALAGKAGLVYAADELLAEVKLREELCTTAIGPGFAIPHPRHPLPYDIEASFVVVGLTGSGIPFGAMDGSLTRLFFLICAKDDRTHLHVLSRLGQMLHDEASVAKLLEAQSESELQQTLVEFEQHALASK